MRLAVRLLQLLENVPHVLDQRSVGPPLPEAGPSFLREPLDTELQPADVLQLFDAIQPQVLGRVGFAELVAQVRNLVDSAVAKKLKGEQPDDSRVRAID